MPTVRPTDGSDAEIDLIATRMRATLVEVLGADRGETMYPLDWLRDRVREHLDPTRLTGAVRVCVDDDGVTILGHTIVRVEHDDDLGRHGLFSTTYVDPSARRRQVATLLLTAGEAWMRDHGLTEAVTYTDPDNAKLVALYERHGYACTVANEEFVRLHRQL